MWKFSDLSPFACPGLENGSPSQSGNMFVAKPGSELQPGPRKESLKRFGSAVKLSLLSQALSRRSGPIPVVYKE
jgi:hypothetical protein